MSWTRRWSPLKSVLKDRWMNLLITKVFVEQPLALPGSAIYVWDQMLFKKAETYFLASTKQWSKSSDGVLPAGGHKQPVLTGGESWGPCHKAGCTLGHILSSCHVAAELRQILLLGSVPLLVFLPNKTRASDTAVYSYPLDCKALVTIMTSATRRLFFI